MQLNKKKIPISSVQSSLFRSLWPSPVCSFITAGYGYEKAHGRAQDI
jgi:hypothetical protein